MALTLSLTCLMFINNNNGMANEHDDDEMAIGMFININY